VCIYFERVVFISRECVSILRECVSISRKCVSISSVFLFPESRYLFENAIESQLHNQGSSSFTLSSQNLTVTYHLQHLVGMTFVDLSDNSLRCITGGHLLQCVRVLDLSYNQLSSSDGIHSLEYLEEVNLSNNGEFN